MAIQVFAEMDSGGRGAPGGPESMGIPVDEKNGVYVGDEEGIGGDRRQRV